ncbi:MAG: tripartite tricarboxylate transporter substrate binding protein [Betaproteobacteria bacterium]|nr:tripartite tricarboxylate transporter substrate binding protein [Betaproteobacteria bacterium]
MKSIPVVAALAAAVLFSGVAAAQGAAAGYPARPVRVLVAQTAGGNADAQARLFAARLGDSLGRQFVVDNRPGRYIAWSIAAKSPTDGYTLLAVLPDLTYAPALDRNLPIDPTRDFAPISLMTQTPYLLVVNPSLPARSVKELVALARSNPGKLNFGGGITGAGTHLMSALLFSLAGIKATYIPYKGAAQSLIDIVAGQIDAGFGTATAALFAQSGKLRALGISTATRSPLFPDLPTIAEQGVPGFDARAFHGWAAPAGTPVEVIRKLSVELINAARSAEIVAAVRNSNSEVVGSTPEQFARFMAAEIPRWRSVVQQSGINVE